MNTHVTTGNSRMTGILSGTGADEWVIAGERR
jgi:hypothetical protein